MSTSLQQIAHQILTLTEQRASTPVLVTPTYLSFRKQFFVELCRELTRHTDRNLRIDWYRKLPGVRTIVVDQLAAWQVKSINRVLQREVVHQRGQTDITLASNDARQSPRSGSDSPINTHPTIGRSAAGGKQIAAVQITATISRPGGKARDLVIGLSDVRQKLPEWTTAIWMGTSQQEVRRWQAA
jgi:hypothetical protein